MYRQGCFLQKTTIKKNKIEGNTHHTHTHTHPLPPTQRITDAADKMKSQHEIGTMHGYVGLSA